VAIAIDELDLSIRKKKEGEGSDQQEGGDLEARAARR
jgi:hypothetical protein